MKRPHWLAIALSAGLCACSHVPARHERATPMNPAHSKAMNVLIAAGYVDGTKNSPIRDVPKGNAAQSVPGKESALIDTGYAVSNVLAPPPGVGLGFALGMSAMSLLLPSPHEPLATSMVLAWMPQGLAATPEAAMTIMQRLVDGALDGALVEVLKPPYRVVPRNPKQPGRVVITGGECTNPGSRCTYWPMVYWPPIPGAAPDFLGGGPAWIWIHPDRRSEVIASALYRSAAEKSGIADKYIARFPDLAVYQAMSARLPEWVFLYLAPGTVSDGREFILFPVVLNRGEPLSFTTPAG